MRLNGPTRAGTALGSGLLLLFTAFWCLVLAGLDFELGRKVWQQARTSGYVEGQATIEKSEVSRRPGKKGKASYGVEMSYTYEVEGKRFTSDRYAFQATRSSDSKWAYAAVSAHANGTTVPVYYDAAKPELAVLRRGIDGSDIFILMFLTPFHMVALALVMVSTAPLRARMRREVDEADPEPGGRERIYVGEWRPVACFLAVFGFASFFGIFAIAIPFGFHPPLTMVNVVWSAGFGLALWVALNTHRRIRAGEYDLVVDRHAAKLTLPAMHGRMEREEVKFREVAKIEAREVIEVANGRRARRRSRKFTEVILLTRGGTELLLKKPWTLTEGQRWAEWLRARLVG